MSQEIKEFNRLESLESKKGIYDVLILSNPHKTSTHHTRHARTRILAITF